MICPTCGGQAPIGALHGDAYSANDWLNSPEGQGSMKAAYMKAESGEVWLGDYRGDYPNEVTRKELNDMAEAIEMDN